MKKTFPYQLRRYSRPVLLLGAGLILVVSALLPSMIPRSVSALQLTSRSLSLSTGVPSATSVQYTFTFTVPSTSDVEGLKFIACTTATGTYDGGSCTAPAGLSFSSRTFGTQSGWQGAVNFAVDATGANDCTPAANVICANRTDATAQTATSRSIRFDTITNPSATNTAFFVGIQTYNINTYTVGGKVDRGSVASATTQTLTINAAVAEVLNFCVGATTVNNSTGSIASDCTGVSGTNVNIGTLDTGFTNASPVSTNGGDNENGVAMLRTNAINGATVSYRAIQQSGTNHLGTLRISTAVCNATDTDVTDQCIRAQGTTQGTFTAGTERYGMTIAGINCQSTTSYSCVFTSGTYNLVRDAAYDGDGANTDSGTFADTGPVAGTTTFGYAWDDTGTFDQIASSTGSTTKVVDDETMILKFAATPSITTPFGAYAAQADFITVATY